MSSKAQVMALARRFGFVLDEDCSGQQANGEFVAIFDHPTKAIGSDCRSITCTSYPPGAAAYVWNEAFERLSAEGPLLGPCPLGDDCDYHASFRD